MIKKTSQKMEKLRTPKYGNFGNIQCGFYPFNRMRTTSNPFRQGIFPIFPKLRISAIVTACFRFSVTGKALVFEGSVIVV
jgi:hypothetical protein